jgi:hypothetical protein
MNDAICPNRAVCSLCQETTVLWNTRFSTCCTLRNSKFFGGKRRSHTVTDKGGNSRLSERETKEFPENGRIRGSAGKFSKK